MKSLHFLLPLGLSLNSKGYDNSSRGVLAFTPPTAASFVRPMPLAESRYIPSSLSTSVQVPSTSLSFASNDDDAMIILSNTQNDDNKNISNDGKIKIKIKNENTSSPPTSSYKDQRRKKNVLQERKRDWINRSLTYYSTVSREAKRRENGQYVPSKIELNQYRSNFITAKKLYFARHKIKRNQPRHAERIYRKLIDDLLKEQEEEGGSCDHAQIAISTLLLALLLQRQDEIKETRATFIRFFRLITMSSSSASSPTTTMGGGSFEFKECTCSAKVLQAFALFEMKQRNVKKAYALIQMAVKLDSELEPVLQWKQFRDAKELIQNGSRNRRRKSSDL